MESESPSTNPKDLNANYANNGRIDPRRNVPYGESNNVRSGFQEEANYPADYFRDGNCRNCKGRIDPRYYSAFENRRPVNEEKFRR